MADALRSRHIGRVMYAYRYEHRPALTQGKLGEWLGMTQVQVSRLERATRPPSDLDKLSPWAETLGIPENELWFRLPAQQPKPSPAAPSQTAFTWFDGDAAVPAIVKNTEPALAVHSIRETTQIFRQLDNKFGGGHARDVVHTYLTDEVAPALHGRGPDATAFTAVAELNQLAGWMAYDTGDAISGRRHLQRAFQLCQHAGDEALSAEMLAGVSHQAAHARNAAMSVNLARAARSTAARTDLAALHSETAVMEAHGRALLRDKTGSRIALSEAENAFERADHQDRPEWLRYYDEAYLAAKMAHCLRELGDLRVAERYARRSLEMTAGYERGRLFNMALLGAILADLREIDAACDVGRDALHLARRLHSARTVTYLQDFADRLRRHEAVPAVANLSDELQRVGI